MLETCPRETFRINGRVALALFLVWSMLTVLSCRRSERNFAADGSVEDAARPEFSLISENTAKANLPSPEDKIYIQDSYIENLTEAFFNGSVDPRATRSVTITGRNITIDGASDANNLFSKYDSKHDIKEMAVFADTLIIRSVWHLPQTDLTIRARELRFEDMPGSPKAQIDTTPNSTWSKPPDPATETLPGGDGIAGRRGGSVKLFVNTFTPTPDQDQTVRFNLKGGNGQDAGISRKGNNGDGMAFKCHGQVRQPSEDPCSGNENIVYEVNCYPFGQASWPGDGKPGTRGGKPGDGGDGGSFTSNFVGLERLVSQEGGSSGNKAEHGDGGDPGKPQYSVKRVWKEKSYISYCGFPAQPPYATDYTHVSQKGAVAVSPSSAKSKGSLGQSTIVNDSTAWFHPHIVQAVLAHAKDLYLEGGLHETQQVLDQYANLIDEYQKHLETPDVLLTEQSNEIDALRHRLAANLDYFGNPAGWTPMLSFEANQIVYKKEVESSIKLLYLSYWLQSKAAEKDNRRKALTEGASKLTQSVHDDILKYRDAQKLISDLSNVVAEVVSNMNALQLRIKQRQDELLSDANNIVTKRHDVPFWKKAFSTLGALAKVIPVYQPILGTVGTGMDVVAHIDENTPWETAASLSNVADQFSESNLKASAKDLDDVLSHIDPNNAENAREYAKRVLPVAKKLAEAQRKFSAATQSGQAPQSEVEAELNKLKAADPEFQRFVSDIEALNSQKMLISQRIADATQSLTALSSGISKNLLAIDSVGRALGEVERGMDHQTLLYVSDMEQQAKHRLLLYRYWMAKAFEFRILAPYPDKLNLDDLISRFKELASTSHDPLLTKAQFEDLAEVYRTPLSKAAQAVITKLNTQGLDSLTTVTYTLTADERATLNSSSSVRVNLMELGRLDPAAEEQRIKDVRIKEMTAHATGGPANATLRFFVENRDRSYFRSGINWYVFKLSRPVVWSGSYDLSDVAPAPKMDKLGVDAQSLLKVLLDSQIANDAQVQLFSQPSIWSDLIVRKQSLPADVNIIIDSLKLEIEYYYRPLTEKLAILDVRVSDGLKPTIGISEPDKSGRKDGVGHFARVYYPGMKLTLTAPLTFGEYKFQEWKIDGTTFATKPETGVTLPLIEPFSTLIVAHYAKISP